MQTGTISLTCCLMVGLHLQGYEIRERRPCLSGRGAGGGTFSASPGLVAGGARGRRPAGERVRARWTRRPASPAPCSPAHLPGEPHPRVPAACTPEQRCVAVYYGFSESVLVFQGPPGPCCTVSLWSKLTCLFDRWRNQGRKLPGAMQQGQGPPPGITSSPPS